MEKKDQGPGQERRRDKRIQKHFILSYFNLNDPQARFDASQLKNISLGGMCFITSKPFATGTRLGIELKTPFLAELTYLEGVVLESRERLKGIIYETRLAFDNLNPQAQFVIHKLIQFFEREAEKGSYE